jgi:hypothetical protein
MLVHRRLARPLTLACATAALAVAPGTALAMPAREAPVREIPTKANVPQVEAVAQPSASPIVREVQTDGDSTIALVISGSALLIAAGAVAISGYDHRRLSRLA